MSEKDLWTEIKALQKRLGQVETIEVPGTNTYLRLSGGLLTGDLALSATGVLYSGPVASGNFLMHTFHHPTGLTAIPEGNNFFAGVRAGNLTMGSTATETYHASGNVGIGRSVLNKLTTGYYNSGMGYKTLNNVTTGYHNTAIGGASLLEITTGHCNTAIGLESGYNSSGVSLQTIENCTFIGEYAFSTVDGIVFSTAIGSNAYVTKSHQVVLGDTSIVETLLRGNVGIDVLDPVAPLHVYNSSAFSLTALSGNIVLKNPANAGGAGSYGAAIEWGNIAASSFTRRAAIVNVQTSADSDNVGIAVFTHPASVSNETIAEAARFTAAGNLLIGTTTEGMTAGGSLAVAQDFAHRGTLVGFYNTAPIAKPTGVAVTAAGIHAALVSLGLIAA